MTSTDRRYVLYSHGRSWHVILTPTRAFNTYRSLCGRRITSTDLMDELPAAKSCEVCLRIAARQDDPS